MSAAGCAGQAALNVEAIAVMLVRLGCPADRSLVMARQLDRRARMDAARQGVSHDQALGHLLQLMAGGWAASREQTGG